MSDLAVIVPSRGRPQNIARLVQAWKDTEAEAELIVCVDDDDPEILGYLQAVPAGNPQIFLHVGTRRRLVPWLNRACDDFAEDYFAVAFMGDDHLVRSVGWDKALVSVLQQMGTGFAYGNDLLQGQNLPTAWFMTSDIVKTLGYMIPPCLVHMYADNWILETGVALGKIAYLPNVIIEHMHYSNGKAEPSAQYDEVDAFLGPDGIAYQQYKEHGFFDRDVEKLKALIK